MMKLLPITIALTITGLFLAGCQATPVVKPEPIIYQGATAQSHPHWGYRAPDIIPTHWGDEEVNKMCQIGQTQSPINIPNTVVSTNSKTLTPQYHSQDFTITNNGHTIVYTANNPDASHLLINNVDYKLLQFHYHIPSEHTVMDTSYPLEIHFVHQNANKQLAVVGVLVNVGSYNADLQRILVNLPTSKDQRGVLSQLNISSLMPATSQTYAYQGSLTTPPCSEQVQWLLKTQPITLSQPQLETLSKLYQGNNRPVQPQGSRVVNVIN